VATALASAATAFAGDLPVAVWNFDEGQGWIAHDGSGNCNDGVVVGAQWTTGWGNTGLWFDGVGAVVAVPDSLSLSVSNAITITAWVRTYGEERCWVNPIVWKNGAYRFGLNDQRLYAELSVPGPTSVKAGPVLASQLWYFVAMTYDKNEGGYAASLDACDSLMPISGNPIIPVGGPGEWDAAMREIGNVLLDLAETDPAKRYKAFYSGYVPPYRENQVYVGYAYSSDGLNWTKCGKIVERALEDPYVVRDGEVYYLFAEDKEDVPFRNIRRYHSTDCIDWIDDGDVFDVQPGGYPPGWESGDVSSPVVWIENGLWYLLYEGRGRKNLGMIGLANSPDGLNWTRVSSSPVFAWGEGSAWDNKAVVPDDIVKINDRYYMSYHGYGPLGRWDSGIASSTDLLEWTRGAHNPISVADTVMMLSAGDSITCFAADSLGINHYVPYLLSRPHIYINGVEEYYLQKSDFLNQPIAISGDGVGIGAAVSGPPAAFYGVIDEVRIFDRALTPGEIQALFATQHTLNGDINCDNQVTFADINPFVLAFTDPALYQQTYPDCPLENRDINDDGVFDYGDINCFVALLVSGGIPGR